METKYVQRNIIKTLNTTPYFTRSNLEVVLGDNRRTLDYRIAALIRDDIIDPVKPGFYINNKMYGTAGDKTAFLEYIGNIMVYPSYVSLQYALSAYGIIPEAATSFTYVTIKKSRKVQSKKTRASFTYRSIKESLFFGFETRIYKDLQYFFAKPYKALFDLIYLTPLKNTTDLEEFLLNSRINWDIVKKEANEFEIAARIIDSAKMQKVYKFLKKRGLL